MSDMLSFLEWRILGFCNGQMMGRNASYLVFVVPMMPCFQVLHKQLFLFLAVPLDACSNHNIVHDTNATRI